MGLTIIRSSYPLDAAGRLLPRKPNRVFTCFLKSSLLIAAVKKKKKVKAARKSCPLLGTSCKVTIVSGRDGLKILNEVMNFCFCVDGRIKVLFKIQSNFSFVPSAGSTQINN